MIDKGCHLIVVRTFINTREMNELISKLKEEGCLGVSVG